MAESEDLSEELSIGTYSDVDVSVTSSHDASFIVDVDEPLIGHPDDERHSDDSQLAADDEMDGSDYTPSHISIPSGSTFDLDVVGSDRSPISIGYTEPGASDNTSEIDIINSEEELIGSVDEAAETHRSSQQTHRSSYVSPRPAAPEPRTPSLTSLTPPPLVQQRLDLHHDVQAPALVSTSASASAAVLPTLPALPELPGNMVSPRRNVLEWVRDSARVAHLTLSTSGGDHIEVASGGTRPELPLHAPSPSLTVAHTPAAAQVVTASPLPSTSALHLSQTGTVPPDRIVSSSDSDVHQTMQAISVMTTTTVITTSTSTVDVSASRTVPLSAVDSSRLNTSATEFRSPKRKRLESPAKSEPPFDEEAEPAVAGTRPATADSPRNTKKNWTSTHQVTIQNNQNSMRNMNSCTICFEPWSNTGSHRLASLKCGHLFGQSCIVRWLKGGNKCPQCNAKANKKDIRVIFARALRVLDTSERDRALEMLEEEKRLRQKAEVEAAQARLRHQMSLDECNRLKQDIERQRQLINHLRSSGVGAGSSGNLPSTSGVILSQLPSTSHPNLHSYHFDQVIKVSESGNCRVMGYCSRLATLVVSQPSTNALFPGFGVRKISSLDFKTSQYVALHTKAIRDISFNTNNDGLLLSCSIDKMIKMTSLAGNTTVHSYHCEMPLWSCVWNYDDKNYFFGGHQNGTVSVFDIRNTSQYVKQLSMEGSRSPVVSLQYIPHSASDQLRCGGLLVGQLDRVTFYEARPDCEYRPHVLPVEGNIAFVSVEGKTKHMLSSHRPMAHSPAVSHQLHSLSSRTDAETGDVVVSGTNVQTLRGGGTMKQLARSRLILQPDDDQKMLICAADEASLGVLIWDATTGTLRQKLNCQAPVLDICPVTINDSHFLAALTEKNVRLHRWS